MALRILLADDHALFREGLRVLLTARGFDVIAEVGTGVAAVEEAQRLAPDLIVLDLDMPEMGGLEATRLIKTAMPDVAIVILTASERETSLFEAVKSGALGYVLKTMSSADLVQQIDAAARWLESAGLSLLLSTTTDTLMDTLSVDMAEAAARRLWTRLGTMTAAAQ